MGHKSSEDELEHGDDLDNVELEKLKTSVKTSTMEVIVDHKSLEDELEHGDDLDNIELDNVEQEDSPSKESIGMEVGNVEQEDDTEVKRQFLDHPYFNTTVFEREREQ